MSVKCAIAICCFRKVLSCLVLSVSGKLSYSYRSRLRKRKEGEEIVRMSSEKSMQRRLQDAFIAFDRDGDGSLNEREAISVIRAAGRYLGQKEEDKFFGDVRPQNGMVTSLKLMKPAIELCENKKSDQALVEQFARFDREKNGTIKKKELEEILRTLGEGTAAEQAGLVNLCAKGDKVEYKALVQKLWNY